jgi:hypothetical protein
MVNEHCPFILLASSLTPQTAFTALSFTTIRLYVLSRASNGDMTNCAGV